MFFESGKGSRVMVFAFGLIAFEDGGCAALEGSGGFSGDRAVGGVIEKKGDKGSDGWEALPKAFSQRSLTWIYEIKLSY